MYIDAFDAIAILVVYVALVGALVFSTMPPKK